MLIRDRHLGSIRLFLILRVKHALALIIETLVEMDAGLQTGVAGLPNSARILARQFSLPFKDTDEIQQDVRWVPARKSGIQWNSFRQQAGFLACGSH